MLCICYFLIKQKELLRQPNIQIYLQESVSVVERCFPIFLEVSRLSESAFNGRDAFYRKKSQPGAIPCFPLERRRPTRTSGSFPVGRTARMSSPLLFPVCSCTFPDTSPSFSVRLPTEDFPSFFLSLSFFVFPYFVCLSGCASAILCLRLAAQRGGLEKSDRERDCSRRKGNNCWATAAWQRVL